MEVAKYHFYSDTGLLRVDESRVEPPFWWTGMKNQELQILIYDRDITDFDVSLKTAEGVELVDVKRVPNPNYLFVNVRITGQVNPGFFDIILEKENIAKRYRYELKEREVFNSAKRGVDNSDFIYHIMPDRFANGDISNDSYADMRQRGINRSKMYFRHGGDIQGIRDHLDYIRELGVTAIWLTPILENDQPYASYHGYAITDMYKIDKRFGTNESYKEFVDYCHNNGIKVIKDVVLNHIGHENWLMRDIPDADWLHQWPEFTRSNFRAAIVHDPYRSEYDIKQLKEGWFDYSMPDLNQDNPLLATYLMQNNIWWLEYAGLDDYRIDTWFFPDHNFLNQWVSRMKEEYPDLNLFGETWVQNVSEQAYFTVHDTTKDEFAPNLPSVLDFQLNFAIEDAFTKETSWTSGLSRLYYTLAQDHLYQDPYKNVIFLDNHDKSRIFTTVGEDINKLKSAIGLLMTLRGIPVLYYGTELLFKGDANPDGNVRQDISGGWQEDKINQFVASGRTGSENEIFNYIKKISEYRKTNTALQTGKLTQFVPEEGVYVFFRYDNTKKIMIVLNTNNSEKKIKTKRYIEFLSNAKSLKDIFSDENITDLYELKLQKNSISILEVK
ncbi:MAG: glycoside hydrolase family 13 protein [Saprospiraceae bacterium]|nr:glycoside hydrolase family 13 protein [Saprospiraceae bacterium]